MIKPATNRLAARFSRAADWWLALVLGAIGAGIGSTYIVAVDAQRIPHEFGQYEFAAAVAQACGHGFVDIDSAQIPALADFLALKTDRFSCAQLPAVVPSRPPSFTQGLYRYLMSAVASVWMVRGVSWSDLWPLFGVAYGVAVAVAYGIFRLAVGRVLSLVMATLIMLSPAHLGYLPFLRDYLKAPFILGLILLTGWVVRSVERPRAMLALSIAFGAVLGVGFGFRNDMLIVVPAFVVAILLWSPPGSWRPLVPRVTAVAAAALVFVLTAWPILAAYSRGSNNGHVALLGVMTPFDRPLGVAGSIYEWGYVYLDFHAGTIVASDALRTSGKAVRLPRSGPLTNLDSDYDRAAVGYVLRIARHWPADILVRTYASILRTLAFPFAISDHMVSSPAGLTQPTIVRAIAAQNHVRWVLHGTGAAWVALSLLAVSATDVRRAILLAIGVAYLAGYPAIQFHIRHFFHLEFVVWLAIAFTVQTAFSAAALRLRSRPAPDAPAPVPVRLAARSMLTFATVALVMAAAPLVAARGYQARHVRPLLQRYADAPSHEVPRVAETLADRTLLRLPTFWDRRDPRDPVSAEMLVAELDASCAVARLTFRYDSLHQVTDFSGTIALELPPGEGPTRVLFPAYYREGASHFVGVEVPHGDEACVLKLSRVDDLRPLPMLITLRLPPRWTDARLYQTLRNWESRPGHEAAAIHVQPFPDGARFDHVTLSADTPRRLPPIVDQAEIVRPDPTGLWRIVGTPVGSGSYVMRFAPEEHGPGDRFVVRGEVRRGGVTVGLLINEQWDGGNATVTARGPFVAVLAPSTRATVVVLIANAVADSWLLRQARRLGRPAAWLWPINDVRISHAGWVQESR